MHYDPIKRSLGSVFNKSPFLRKIFYKLLDLLLLRAWHIHNEIDKWAKDRGNDVNILDAGMGFGQYSYYLHSKNSNWKILGVDVKQEQIEDCNQFFKSIDAKNAHFEMADLVKYRKENTYDFILSVDVMEHILEDVEVFVNFAHSLKPGGMLLISTPSDQGGSDVHEGEEGSFIEEHVRDGYNINEIQDKLKGAGFSKVEARYSYGKFGTIAWRLSMKWPILMLGASKLFFIIIPFYYLLVYPFCYVLNYLDTTSNNPTGTGLIVKAWK